MECCTYLMSNSSRFWTGRTTTWFNEWHVYVSIVIVFWMLHPWLTLASFVARIPRLHEQSTRQRFFPPWRVRPASRALDFNHQFLRLRHFFPHARPASAWSPFGFWGWTGWGFSVGLREAASSWSPFGLRGWTASGLSVGRGGAASAIPWGYDDLRGRAGRALPVRGGWSATVWSGMASRASRSAPGGLPGFGTASVTNIEINLQPLCTLRPHPTTSPERTVQINIGDEKKERRLREVVVRCLRKK